MPAFPAYAVLLFEGFSEQRESALLRTEMEDGPPKQVRIRGKVLVTRPIKIGLNSLQDYRSFIAWFSNDLAEGSLWFDFNDPVSGTTKQARFVVDSTNGLEGTPLNPHLVNWSISTSIETWG
jgi:hypothetical protein